MHRSIGGKIVSCEGLWPSHVLSSHPGRQHKTDGWIRCQLRHITASDAFSITLGLEIPKESTLLYKHPSVLSECILILNREIILCKVLTVTVYSLVTKLIYDQSIIKLFVGNNVLNIFPLN